MKLCTLLFKDKKWENKKSILINGFKEACVLKVRLGNVFFSFVQIAYIPSITVKKHGTLGQVQ